MDNEEIEEILKKAIEDPTMFSTIDINNLLSKVEKKTNEFLENKTLKTIMQENYDIVRQIPIASETVEGIYKKLSEYRYVDEVRELHKGKHVRWIVKKTPEKLNNGGIVMNILFKDNGTHVLCRNTQNRFIQYKFDECYTFQKLSADELLILSVYEYLST